MELEKMSIADQAIYKIATRTGIQYETLARLPDDTQMDIILKYVEDNTDIAAIYGIVQQFLATESLNETATYMGLTFEQISDYPQNVQEQLCGAFEMMRGDDELPEVLEDIIRRYENGEYEK